MRTSTLDCWKSKKWWIFRHFQSIGGCKSIILVYSEKDCWHQLREERHALGACSYNKLTEWLQNDDNFRNLNWAVKQCQKQINIHLKLSSTYFTPCNEPFPAALTTGPSYFVVMGLKGKAATQQSHHRPATLNLPIWCFGCWCPEGLWVGLGMHRENVRVSLFDRD